jgi:hypothetical protein
MSVTKSRFSKCNHKGFGGFCHRCQEADRLEAMASGEVKPADKKNRKKDKPEAFSGWSKDDFMKEAKRLRGPQISKKSTRIEQPSDPIPV